MTNTAYHATAWHGCNEQIKGNTAQRLNNRPLWAMAILPTIARYGQWHQCQQLPTPNNCQSCQHRLSLGQWHRMAWVILWRWHQLKRLSCQRLNNRPTAQAMPTHGVGAMNKSRVTLPIIGAMPPLGNGSIIITANNRPTLNNCQSYHRMAWHGCNGSIISTKPTPPTADLVHFSINHGK
ncbi:hypothetical protein NKT77_09900 [Moraxella sp. FZLJ2107]|uniref:hypothetical protein n=1 Tax=unclassified Moraxella TaxID=2685852 RepID=UPI0020C848D6|nr:MULTISPECIES: hypothetical protein [unclassified Moraxella]UTO04800.1 hypothetical protein NKT77_09900 [Moraxella sp. FZLJ2107]UTO21532.1 hypothetical protein NKU06_06705 [Moraxella sp. FZLJ2109]